RRCLLVGARRPDGQAQMSGVVAERPQHSRRDVGARRFANSARTQKVQAEVPRAGADLERALEAAVELGAEDLAQLPKHLGLTDLTKVDPPFGVVARGGHIVIPSVDIADFVRAPHGLHGAVTLPSRRVGTRLRPAEPARGRASTGAD